MLPISKKNMESYDTIANKILILFGILDRSRSNFFGDGNVEEELKKII